MTTTETPAATIQRAANRLRALADAATPGPWAAERHDPDEAGCEANISNPTTWDEVATHSYAGGGITTWANAEYITAMHPGVATKLADWLAWEADLAARAPVTEFQARTAHALAVARQILGEA